MQERIIHGNRVRGLELDGQSRCRHWRSELDIVALRLPCCRAFFACAECHDEAADHPRQVWPRCRWHEPAALCGACGRVMSAAEYLACGDRCPGCHAAFNPGCRLHRSLYFES